MWQKQRVIQLMWLGWEGEVLDEVVSLEKGRNDTK